MIVVMLTLFALVVVGYIAGKLGYLGGDFDRQLSRLVINITCPALILSSAMTGELPDRKYILPLLLISTLTYLVLTGAGFLLPRYLTKDRSVQGSIGFALIFGNVGLPEMGIGGAALASLLAEITAFCFFWIYTYIKIPHEEYGMFRWHQWQPALMGNILKVAFPSMIQRLFSFGAWFIFFVIIEKMGEVAIGISSVVRSTYMIIIIPGIAFASTANTLTSRIIGEGKSDEVMASVWKVVRNSFLCSLVLVVVVGIIPHLVLQIYTDDAALAQAAIPSVYVICVATLLGAFSMTFFEAVSGTGNTAAAMALEFGVLIIYIIYVFLMSKTSTIAGVWTAEWVYNILIGLISLFYIWKADWKKTRI